MKTQLALFIACSALALVASADNFQASSNNKVFNGSNQADAIKACQSDLSTNNFDCSQNIRFLGDIGQPQVGDRRPMPGQGGHQGPPQGNQGGYPGQQGPPQGPSHGGPGAPPQGGPGGHGGGGGYPQPFPPQQPQPPYQPPQPPYHPQPPQHSLPNGSYLRSCRNESMNGSYLSADCKNFRGKYVYSQLDLNRCQAQSDIGNNNGQLDCAPR